MNLLAVKIMTLPHYDDLPLPEYATENAAGMDLLAAVNQPVSLASGERALIETGIVLALPAGFEGQVRPRSGLAIKKGLTVLNSPGTIDADYRGEIKVILINLGQEACLIERGMRVAQLVIAPVTKICWQQESSLDETLRGNGGFGHTGLK